MDSDKYLEGQSMQRPPLFESDHFIYWKNRFETYVKAKDLDLWHIILNGDFPPVARNKETQVLETVPFEQQDDDLKKKLAKNNEAKMVLYNALPKKEYERIFMCKMAKDIWQSLLITHQGNSQVKDNKIDLLVQQYEQFTILEEESIDSGFARFNTIITSLKALDEGFSSKNYVRKFLRALHPKWRAKVTAIEESKDLSSLALYELIGNLKVHEVVMEKDFEIYRGKKERIKSIALKTKKESSDDETLTSGSDDEEYAMVVRNFKKFFRRKGKFVRQPREENKSFRQRDEKKGKSEQKCFRYGDPNHLICDCPKPSRNKDQKVFIGGSWSDSENEAKDKTNDETCLMAQSSNEVCLRTCLEPNEWIKDSGCSKHMTGNKNLFSTYKVYDGVKESLNVTFDESPPYTKLSPLVDDDVGVEQAIRKNTKIVNTNNKEEESIEVDEIVNIKKLTVLTEVSTGGGKAQQYKGYENFTHLTYRLELPEQLSRVHSTFHVSNLKKCLSDETLAIPLDEIQIDDNLHFIEEPVEIMDSEVKRLKQIRIPIVKVCWNSKRGPEFTWEREDQMQKKYPHLFANPALYNGERM
ncbi:zf-CCHC domain-containing protein [Tanacetum coccineum]